MSKKSNAVVVSSKKKSAVARASIVKGTGKVVINSIPLERWGSFLNRMLIQEPLIVADEHSKNIDISVLTNGGGEANQAAATRVAIARGLYKFTNNEKLRKQFLAVDNKLLSGDSRQREPCKPNDSSARARRQKSYR